MCGYKSHQPQWQITHFFKAIFGYFSLSSIMKTFTLVIACLLVTGAHCGAVFTYGVPGTVSVVHQPTVQRVVHQQVVQPVVHQTVVRTPVVHQQVVQPVVHQTLVRTPVVHQTVVRAPVVAQHKELVHVPHHEHGYTIEQSRVVQPKSTVVHHDALTGLPYQQTDYHHAPVVTGSRSSVYHSRPGYIAERTKTYIL